MGGGQPKVVNLLPSASIRVTLEDLFPDAAIEGIPKGVIGPLVVWYETPQSFVLSPAPNGDIGPFYVLTLPTQEVLAIDEVGADVIFESGYPTVIKREE